MGIIIPDELYNFIHTEDIPDQSLWTIALGDANVAMLEPLFKRMFRETTDVTAVPVASDASLDGVIEPKLEKFEFDVPVGEPPCCNGPWPATASRSWTTIRKTPCSARPSWPCGKQERRSRPSSVSSLKSKYG
jgi:hypothetical protein